MSDHMFTVGGKRFYCPVCGANVFRDGSEAGVWICNGCNAEFKGEPYAAEVLTQEKSEKIKAKYAQIIVGGSQDHPYFEILYFDTIAQYIYNPAKAAEEAIEAFNRRANVEIKEEHKNEN